MCQERASGFPEKWADLRAGLVNFQGSPGSFWRSLGSFRGTSGLLLSSTVRELPGKSPGNFCLPPSHSPILSPSHCGSKMKKVAHRRELGREAYNSAGHSLSASVPSWTKALQSCKKKGKFRYLPSDTKYYLATQRGI